MLLHPDGARRVAAVAVMKSQVLESYVLVLRKATRQCGGESGVASGKLGKGGRDVRSRPETFRRNPAGSQSRLGSWPSTQKRVWRRLGATQATKRRQRVPRPCYRAPKFPRSWEPLSSPQRGPCCRRRKAWRCSPAGVQEQGISTPGFPRNRRGPVVSRPERLAWSCQTRKLQAPGRRRAEGRDEDRRTGGYCQAKATKRGEKDTGCRSTP